MPRRCSGQPNRAVRFAVPAVVAALLMAGCSGDDTPAPSPVDSLKTPTSEGQGKGQAHEVALFASPGVITGQLSAGDRRKVADRVGGIVDDWFQRAYVGGEWPRSDFTDVWPRFSRGLKKRAHTERRVTSNAAIGPRIDGVRAEKRRVAVDVMSLDGRPAGATARVDLIFVTSGDVRARVRVRGELYLTPTGTSWEIFGYDLSRTSSDKSPTATTGGTS